LAEIDLLTLGEFTDILIENSNDSYEYPAEATQEDINNFFGGLNG